MNEFFQFIAMIGLIVAYGGYSLWRAIKLLPTEEESEERIDRYLREVCGKYHAQRIDDERDS